MNFKRITHCFFLSSLIVLLFACSDEATEARLVDLHTTAAQDVISIQFPYTTETVVSVNSLTALSVQGLKNNGIDSVSLASQVDWSVSAGAQSTIDQNGHLSAGPTAEEITVTAKLGILSTTTDIRISAAKFDRVTSLDKNDISLEMCQSQNITPYGIYIDASGTEEEPRKVDNTVIGSIEWIILNKADNSASQSAYIETDDNNTTTLYSLAPGDLIVQAKATSAYSGNVVTSDINQTIGNGLDSVKICSSSTTDYAGCSNVTSDSVEQDNMLSFIAIGQYASGSYQNISLTSKWSISNTNMSAVLSTDPPQIEVTGEEVPSEDTSTTSTLYLACGDIDQTIADETDITKGIILVDQALSCTSTSTCQGTSAGITISQLTVSSFEVFANDNKLTDSSPFTLNLQPDDEIVLKVSAIYSSSSDPIDITENENIYENKSDTVIEQKENTPGTYTVLTAGTAQIVLEYRGKIFVVTIEIPEIL